MPSSFQSIFAVTVKKIIENWRFQLKLFIISIYRKKIFLGDFEGIIAN